MGVTWIKPSSRVKERLRVRAYPFEAVPATGNILSHKLCNLWNLTSAAYLLARSRYQLGKVLERLGDDGK